MRIIFGQNLKKFWPYWIVQAMGESLDSCRELSRNERVLESSVAAKVPWVIKFSGIGLKESTLVSGISN